MDAIISGAVLASLSGLTALAFKHPSAFARLYVLLNVSVTALFLGLTIWQAAVHVTWTGVQPYLDAVHAQEARSAKQALALPFVWICVAYGALLVFFWVNLKLPAFIRSSTTDPGEDSGES